MKQSKDKEISNILAPDWMKLALFTMLAIAILTAYGAICAYKDAYYYNFATILLLITAYILAAILVHWERDNYFPKKYQKR